MPCCGSSHRSRRQDEKPINEILDNNKKKKKMMRTDDISDCGCHREH
jgi:hypothetical protein